MKSIKLAIIALLGFSTACSTVKDSSKSKEVQPEKAEVTPSIVVMYGVRRPVSPSNEIKSVKSPTLEQTPAETESKPQDKTK